MTSVHIVCIYGP